MTSGIEAGIFDALLFRLSELTTVLDVFYPGLEAVPVGNRLEARIVPNSVFQVTFGDEGLNRHEGLMQIDVVWQKGVGIIAPAEEGSLVVAHFKRGTAIIRNGLTVRTRPPRMSQPVPDGGWIRLPVIVPWFADTPNPT